MRTLYTIALRLALPLILLRLWWRGRREPGYREGVEERFGFYSGSRPEKVVWVHAVSVGEARAAAPLVRALKEALPDHAVLMTGTTAAGRETHQAGVRRIGDRRPSCPTTIRNRCSRSSSASGRASAS